VIPGTVNTPREKFTHIIMKSAIRYALNHIEIPDEYLQDTDIDPNLAVFRRVRAKYRTLEQRTTRTDENEKAMKILELLFQDKYTRERIGWWIFEMHKEIEAGTFHFEDYRYGRGDKVGYNPFLWYGAKTGRGHAKIAKEGIDP
jgi:hypothetical protein